MITQIYPILLYEDCSTALSWLTQVLGFTELSSEVDRSGAIIHAEMWVGTTALLLKRGFATGGAGCYVQVTDADLDAHYAKVQETGAEIVQPLTTGMAGMENARHYQVRDEGGYIWTIGTYQPPNRVWLRDVYESDIPILFVQQIDPLANHMAAFTNPSLSDQVAFTEWWERILANTEVKIQVIIFNGEVAGSIVSFELFEERTIGYWLGQRYWGNGIATQAVRQFVQIETTRPLYARVAKDNLGSKRVLEKGGFVQVGEDQGFAHARGTEIEEFIFRLE